MVFKLIFLISGGDEIERLQLHCAILRGNFQGGRLLDRDGNNVDFAR